MKDAWPVKAQALGGRHYRDSPEGNPCVDQNFDTYSVEYTFADGTKLFMDGRCMAGCQPDLLQLRPRHQGHRRSSPSRGDCGLPSSTYKGQKPGPRRHDLAVQGPAGRAEPLPERVERPGRRHPRRQALQRGRSAASRPASSARWAARPPTPARKSRSTRCSTAEQEYAPGVDKLTMDSPAPVKQKDDGKYPIPHARHRHRSRVLISAASHGREHSGFVGGNWPGKIPSSRR